MKLIFWPSVLLVTAEYIDSFKTKNKILMDSQKNGCIQLLR